MLGEMIPQAARFGSDKLTRAELSPPSEVFVMPNLAWMDRRSRLSIPISLQFRPNQLPGCDLSDLLRVARVADEAGLYGVHFGEHIVMGRNLDSYPHGTYLHKSDTPWLDAVAAMSAVGAVTKTLRVSAGVMLTVLRPPVLLAKSLASIDVLCQGRLELGVGIGWQKEELRALGCEWENRYARFWDGIRVCRMLWSHDQPVSYCSEFTTFDELWCLPRPVQRRIPLIFGIAINEKSIKRIAELGDGWCPLDPGLDGIRVGVTRLRDAFAEADRDPAALIVRAPVDVRSAVYGGWDVQKIVEQLPAMKTAGVTTAAVSLPDGLESMAQVDDFIHALAGAAALLR
jgi:probable F420-dependent oxidoreductase